MRILHPCRRCYRVPTNPISWAPIIFVRVGSLGYCPSTNYPATSPKVISKHYEGKQLDLITRKDVYPYDYMDSFDRFNEMSLPPIKEFYSKLYENDIPKTAINMQRK